MVGLSSSLLLAGATLATVSSAFPLAKLDSIVEKALEMNKRGLVKDPEAQRALNHVNKRGLSGLLSSTLTPVQNLLQTLDLPTPQPTGLLAVPDAAHPYKAPGPTDVRGLCPTLNTMANHGYISRSGITTFAEAANGCQQAFGFAFDICTGLSALGRASPFLLLKPDRTSRANHRVAPTLTVLAGGDLVSGKMSIAGADSRVPNTLGANPGIEVHGPFEIDGSITRADTYTGDNHSFQKSRFDAWYAQANETSAGLFDFKTMSANQLSSYQESLTTNPQATFGLKYFVVSYAERVFIPAALPNGTTQAVADYANIAPFFLEERFPPGWFRRATPYTALDTVTDVLDMYLTAPVTLGGNEDGQFVPLNASLPTSSPEALLCFTVKELFDGLPGSAAAVVEKNALLYNTFVSTIFGELFGASTDFNCDLSSYGQSGGNNVGTL